ncbi:MAG: hypothetical protein Q4D57_00050 [Clostridia bacterium]|nr:hypothetical protein [Clostridia bacterium]
MEDLTEKISSLLGDPEIMDKIQNLSGMFGSSENNKSTDNEDKNETNETAKDKSDDFGFSPDMLGTLFKIMPLISSLGKDDKYTKFLKSLKPLLSEERQKKLGDSAKILKLMRILPLIKDQGLF